MSARSVSRLRSAVRRPWFDTLRFRPPPEFFYEFDSATGSFKPPSGVSWNYDFATRSPIHGLEPTRKLPEGARELLLDTHRSAHYIAVFCAFGGRETKIHSRFDQPIVSSAPVALAQHLYFSPRQVYAEMRTRTFDVPDKAAIITCALRVFVRLEDYAAARVALRAFTNIAYGDTTRSQRAAAKAAVLHPLSCRLYFTHDMRERGFLRVLLGRMSLVDMELGDRVRFTESAEYVLRPLDFLLGQALRIRSTAKLEAELAQANAVHEMEGPRNHLREQLKNSRTWDVSRPKRRKERKEETWARPRTRPLDLGTSGELKERKDLKKQALHYIPSRPQAPHLDLGTSKERRERKEQNLHDIPARPRAPHLDLGTSRERRERQEQSLHHIRARPRAPHLDSDT